MTRPNRAIVSFVNEHGKVSDLASQLNISLENGRRRGSLERTAINGQWARH